MDRIKERNSRILLIILLCSFFLAACARRPPELAPRPHASYLHWLETQSMLSRAPEYINQVSQSERVWLNSSSQARPDVLLAAASEWAKLSPSNRDFYKRASADLKKIVELGVRGVFLGQLGENLDVWLSESASTEAPGASIDPSSGFGSAEEFARLLERAEDLGLETGSDLPPASTGRGPDFILQARNASGHRGLYAMLPMPEDIEIAIPPPRGEWDASPIEKKTVEDLAARGILPKAIRRDEFSWASSGWAATGNVDGVDGKPRRWLYRYEKTPDAPVVMWQDPSGAARQILAAAIIRQTGLDGRTLLGIRASAWMGLEPKTALDENGETSFSPGIEAVNDLARQIAQYGGWALQADPLPPDAVLEILKGPCDFCQDDLTPLALLYGMAAGDARPMEALYAWWLKNSLPFNRLARGLNPPDEIPAPLLNLIPDAHIKIDSYASMDEFSRLEEKRTGAKDLSTAFRELCVDWFLSLPGLVFLDMDALTQSPAGKRRLDLMNARRRLGLDLASTEASLVPERDVMALLHRLPDGRGWLSILNLGNSPREVVIDLPAPARGALNPLNGQEMSGADGRKIRLALDVWQAQNVLLYWK